MNEKAAKEEPKEKYKNAIREALEEIIKKNTKATLTIEECARFSGIGRDKILELVHKTNSDFPCFKVGSKFLINRDMFINWLNRITEEKRVI